MSHAETWCIQDRIRYAKEKTCKCEMVAVVKKDPTKEYATKEAITVCRVCWKFSTWTPEGHKECDALGKIKNPLI